MKRRRTVSKAPPPVESTLASINSIIDGTCLNCSKPIPPDSPSDIYCGKGNYSSCQDAAGAAMSEPLPLLQRGGAVRRPDPEGAVRMVQETPPWRSLCTTAHYIDSSWAGVEGVPGLAGGPRLWTYAVRIGCACGRVLRSASHPFDDLMRSSGQLFTQVKRDLMAQCGRAFAEHALPNLTGRYHGLDITEPVGRDGPVGYPAGGTIIFRCRCGYGVRASGTDLDGTWTRARHAFEEHQRENPPPSRIPFEAHPSNFADIGHLDEHVSIGFSTRSVLMTAGELEGARRRAAEASAGGDVTYVVDSDSPEQGGD